MGGEGHMLDMANRMRENQKMLQERRERSRNLKKNYISPETIKTSEHQAPENLESIKEEIRQKISLQRRKTRIKTFWIIGITLGIVLIMLLIVCETSFTI